VSTLLQPNPDLSHNKSGYKIDSNENQTPPNVETIQHPNWNRWSPRIRISLRITRVCARMGRKVRPASCRQVTGKLMHKKNRLTHSRMQPLDRLDKLVEAAVPLLVVHQP
jgi:hypothetical protein